MVIKILSGMTALAADEQIVEFSDIADQPLAVKNTIMKLAVLGAIEGNEGIGGTFRPNAHITQNEVVTVAMRCAGYSDKLPGTWPGNHVSKAERLGLPDDVDFEVIGSTAATRAEMSIICEALLGINMVTDNTAPEAGVIKGDADSDGFAEAYYTDAGGDKKNGTILHKVFNGVYYKVAYVANNT